MANSWLAAVVCSTMIVLTGRWAVIPTWLLFILGNTSPGGAVAPPLLPQPYASSAASCPGATVGIVRTAVYFRQKQHLEPLAVQAGVACM